MTDRIPVVIVAGGDAVPTDVASRLPSPAFIIAADSGLHSAVALELEVGLLVGDLDSAHPEAIALAKRIGTTIERHPQDKDVTDLELALEAAIRRGLGPALVVGGASFDRLDHFLANALLMAADRFAALEPVWWVKGAEVHVVRTKTTIRGTIGDVVTLLPVGGPALGTTTAGLRWSLTDETLEPGSTRGVSNQLISETASVSLTGGVLLAIHGGPA